MDDFNEKHLHRAIKLAKENIAQGGGPFGAVITKNGEIIAEGTNGVSKFNDPTAHAEITAIRKACSKLNSFQLDDCIIYSSCEPCPMCFGAIYWARPKKVFYALTKDDATEANFDDRFIYRELSLSEEKRSIPFIHCQHEKASSVFETWKKFEEKTLY